MEDEGEDEEAHHEGLIGGGQLVSRAELVHGGEEVSKVHGTLLSKVRENMTEVFTCYLCERFEVADLM